MLGIFKLSIMMKAYQGYCFDNLENYTVGQNIPKKMIFTLKGDATKNIFDMAQCITDGKERPIYKSDYNDVQLDELCHAPYGIISEYYPLKDCDIIESYILQGLSYDEMIPTDLIIKVEECLNYNQASKKHTK